MFQSHSVHQLFPGTRLAQVCGFSGIPSLSATSPGLSMRRQSTCTGAIQTSTHPDLWILLKVLDALSTHWIASTSAFRYTIVTDHTCFFSLRIVEYMAVSMDTDSVHDGFVASFLDLSLTCFDPPTSEMKRFGNQEILVRRRSTEPKKTRKTIDVQV